MLNQTLYCGKEPTPLEYAQILSDGMSQPTTNLIASLYNIQPRLLLSNQQEAKLHKSKQSIVEIKEEQNVYSQPDQKHNYSSSSSSMSDVDYSNELIYQQYYNHQISVEIGFYEKAHCFN